MGRGAVPIMKQVIPTLEGIFSLNTRAKRRVGAGVPVLAAKLERRQWFARELLRIQSGEAWLWNCKWGRSGEVSLPVCGTQSPCVYNIYGGVLSSCRQLAKAVSDLPVPTGPNLGHCEAWAMSHGQSTHRTPGWQGWS